MRIFESAKPATNRVADVQHVIERALHTTDGSPRHVVVEMILHRLGGAGYVIAHKSDLPAQECVDGSRALHHCLYLNAVSLMRGARPSAEAVAMALGGASPDGPEGNVWRLFDQRLKAGGYTVTSDEPDDSRFTPAGIPAGVTRVTVGTDTSRGRHSVCVFGWGEAGQAWLLHRLDLPAPDAGEAA